MALPRLLTVVGGRLEADEFFDEGAARELAEETGILIAPPRLEFCQHSELVWANPAKPPDDCPPSPARSSASSPSGRTTCSPRSVSPRPRSG
ncbi:NUDIX domain-containing protein [Streptomyces sp. NPDC056632]|uniref:NUDIX domain-containing protein n=1 Tax=Streptomyces sp. NPDC056632 TaxID=3345884 RepID=UPI0036B85C21